MRAVTLQPAAGAHGELTGILMIRAYHRSRGDLERDEVLVPDSAHGTNPATASMAGFKTVTIPSAADGGVDLDAFEAALGPRTAAVMITNPSTLGLFERRIGRAAGAVHAAGALAYMDGANLNAILGRFKPGEAGFDVMHFNTHKTFSTPHGGGGPGAGPVGVGEHLVPFLPAPRVVREDDGTFRLERAGERPTSIGRRARLHGQHRRARARVRLSSARTAAAGCDEVSDDAVLAANYLQGAPGRDVRHALSSGRASTSSWRPPRRSRSATGVRTLDVAKRLIDHGFHPPTIYFPLIVEEGMLIEPTETESLETLDAFADALLAIAARGRRGPGAGHGRAARRAGAAPRRGDRGPAAEPALAADGRRGDALPGLSRAEHGRGAQPHRTVVRLRLTAPGGCVDSCGAAHRPDPCRGLGLPRTPRRKGGSQEMAILGEP